MAPGSSPESNALLDALLAGRAAEALALLRGYGAQALSHVGPGRLTSPLAAVLGGAARVPGVCAALAAAGADFDLWLLAEYSPDGGSWFDGGDELVALLVDRLGKRRADELGVHLWEGATAMSLACCLLDVQAVEQLLAAGASAAEGLGTLAMCAEESLKEEFDGSCWERDGRHVSRWPAGALASGRGGVSRHPAARIARALLAHGADPLEPSAFKDSTSCTHAWGNSSLGSLAHAGGPAARAVVDALAQQAADGTLRLGSKRRAWQLLLAAAHLGHLPLLRYGIKAMEGLLEAEQALQRAGLPAGEGDAVYAGRGSMTSSDADRMTEVLEAAMDGCAAAACLELLLASRLPFCFEGRPGGRSLLSSAALTATWRPHMPRLAASGARVTLRDLLDAVDDMSVVRVAALLACGRPPADVEQPTNGYLLRCPVHRAVLSTFGRWAGGPRCPTGRARAGAVLELLLDAGYRPTVWRNVRVPNMYGMPQELVGHQVEAFDPFDHYHECSARLQQIAKAGRWSPRAHHHWPREFQAVARLLLLAGRHGSGGGMRAAQLRRSRRLSRSAAADEVAGSEAAPAACLLPTLPHELLLRVIKEAADPLSAWLPLE